MNIGKDGLRQGRRFEPIPPQQNVASDPHALKESELRYVWAISDSCCLVTISNLSRAVRYRKGPAA